MMMDDFIEEYNEKKKRYLLFYYIIGYTHFVLLIVSIIIARANVEATVFCYLNTTRFL